MRITNEVRKDLELWKTFLSQYNEITYFRYQKLINSDTIRLSSDACKSGFGACYGSKWIQGTYPNSWQQLHIIILELFPIYLLMKICGHWMSNSNILFLCDNKAVTDIINKQSSKDKTVMNIIRPLVMEAIQHNIMLLAKHISGKSNILSNITLPGDRWFAATVQHGGDPYQHPSRPTTRKLHNKIIQDLESAFSISVNSQYKSNWNNFAECMHHLGKSPLPTSSYDVALYVTHVRHNEKIKSTTLRSRLSAIAYYHKINSHNDPTKDFIISKLVKSHAK